MRTRMCFHDVAWEQSEAIQEAWIHALFEKENLMDIGRFILKHRRGKAIGLCDPNAGGFNMSFRMKYEDGSSTMIRFPKPGTTMFPEEKVRREVDIMRCIHQHTTIPVPFISHWGPNEKDPLGLGPFIIMEYINHTMDVGDTLNTPRLMIKDRPILDPKIDNAKPKLLYKHGIEACTEVSELHLQTFLNVLHEQEDMAINKLSESIQQSWGSGDFWVVYAARKSFAFDAVFWKKIDGRFFGAGTSSEDDRWKERLDILTDDEKANMEKIVERKMEEMRTRVLAWEPDEIDLEIVS
ncbi:hypothetical protein N7488_007642 [Penicillium malachiteum]|nr:hypothetical protein N7488_007642 [Penicillium malachiteum]